MITTPNHEHLGLSLEQHTPFTIAEVFRVCTVYGMNSVPTVSYRPRCLAKLAKTDAQQLLKRIQ